MGPAEKAVAFRRDLDELTRRAKLTDTHAGITRTADQRRADLLAELPSLVLHSHRTCATNNNGSPGAGASGTADVGAGACRVPQPTSGCSAPPPTCVPLHRPSQRPTPGRRRQNLRPADR